MTAHDKFTFESEPGFCPDCGSILPLLGTSSGVMCYTCRRSFGPEVFGNMEHSYTVQFNTVSSVDAKKRRDGEEDAEGPIVERRCPKSNMDSTCSQLALDPVAQSQQDTSYQGREEARVGNEGDAANQEKPVMSAMDTKLFMTGIEKQIEYAEDHFKHLTEKLGRTREVFLQARQTNNKVLQPAVECGGEISVETPSTHLIRSTKELERSEIGNNEEAAVVLGSLTSVSDTPTSEHQNDTSALLTVIDEGTFVAITSRSNADWNNLTVKARPVESSLDNEKSQEEMSKPKAVAASLPMVCDTKCAVSTANNTFSSSHFPSDNETSCQPTLSNVQSESNLNSSSQVMSPDNGIRNFKINIALSKNSKFPTESNSAVENNAAKKRNRLVVPFPVPKPVSPCSDNNIPKKRSKTALNIVEPNVHPVHSENNIKKNESKRMFHSKRSNTRIKKNLTISNLKQTDKVTSKALLALSLNVKMDAVMQESNHAFPFDTSKLPIFDEVDVNAKGSKCNTSSTSVITSESIPRRKKLHNKRSRCINNCFYIPKVYSSVSEIEEIDVSRNLRKNNGTSIASTSNIRYRHGKTESIRKNTNCTVSNTSKIRNNSATCQNNQNKNLLNYGLDAVQKPHVKDENQIPSKKNTGTDISRDFSPKVVKQKSTTDVSNKPRKKQNCSRKCIKDVLKFTSGQLFHSKPLSLETHAQLANSKKEEGNQSFIKTKQMTTRSHTASLGRRCPVQPLVKTSQTSVATKTHNKPKTTSDVCVPSMLRVNNSIAMSSTTSPELLSQLNKKSKVSIPSDEHAKIKAKNQPYFDYHCKNANSITNGMKSEHGQAVICMEKTKVSTSKTKNKLVKNPLNLMDHTQIVYTNTGNKFENYSDIEKASRDKEHKLLNTNKSSDLIRSVDNKSFVPQNLKLCVNKVNSNRPESSLCLGKKQPTNFVPSCSECANALNFPDCRENECSKTMFLLSNFPRHYEVPTISSQIKSVSKRAFINSGQKMIPFIVAKSTMPSHNINVQIQDVISIIRSKPFKGNLPGMRMVLSSSQNTPVGAEHCNKANAMYYNSTPILAQDDASISNSGTKLSVLPNHFNFHEWQQPLRSRREDVWALASVKSSRCCSSLAQKESNYQAVLDNYTMNTRKQDISVMSLMENSQGKYEKECLTHKALQEIPISETAGMRGRRLLCEIIGYLYADLQWISGNLDTNPRNQMVSKEKLHSLQEKVAHNTTMVHEALRVLDEARELQNKYRKLAQAVAQNIEVADETHVAAILSRPSTSSRLRGLMLSIKNFKQELTQVS